MIQHTDEQVQLEQSRRQENFKAYLHSEEYQAKLIQRLKINDACELKSEARTATWNLCARPDNPAEGCIFFIETFGWTFDPRPHAPFAHLPFILFEYQKETIHWLIDHIDKGRDGLIEKSRDMGVSWVVFVWVIIWYWLFRDGVNILLGSYKEALVDNRSKDSLFGMIDYGVDGLPKWLMPRGFNKDKHRTQMKYVNPANGNLITGDTMNPDFGRGTRKTAIFFDEHGSWDYAKDAWESAGDSTSCRISNSTPKGYNYYKILGDSGIDKLTLHWKRHPLKDQQWYEFECARRTPEEVAQELDISYNKSQEGRVYTEWNEENVEVGNFEYDHSLPLYVGWDFGKCMTDDTQALTKGGWKHHSELNEGDLIYTLNPDTGLGEWQKMRGKLVEEVDTEITSVKGKGFKTRFTNEHKWPVLREGVFKLGSFDSITSYEYIPSGAELSSLPTNKEFTDSFVELMAWYWTEGYNNDGAIEISQAKSENFERIRNCLFNEFGEKKQSLIGVKEPAYTERVPVLRKNTNLPLIRWYINKVAAQEIIKYTTGNKIINYSFINKLTKEQLELFIEVSLLADGRSNRLKQSEDERTEVFAYANLLLGKKVSYSREDMGVYGKYLAVDIFTSKPKIVPYNFKRRGKVTRERYVGRVWCPTVDNHIWLARSQGSVYFTGNSDDTGIIWVQPYQGKWRVVDTYRNNNKLIDFYIPFVTGVLPSDGYVYSKQDLEVISKHRGWQRGTHFGDPAGRFTSQVSNQSVIKKLEQANILINFKDEWKVFHVRKDAAKMMILDGIKINQNARTDYFNLCMISAGYSKSKIDGMDQIRSFDPRHDWTSHYRSAFEYLALGIRDFVQPRKQVFDKFPKNESFNRFSRHKKSIGY